VGFETVLNRLADLDSNVWVRFLYGHPESMSDRVIDTVAANANLCPYFDLPIQHAAPGVLKRMGRHYDADQLLRLFQRIRTRVPGAALRTTVIVGFPGESDADFQMLMDFIEQARFDHLGVFTYSDAEDLPSHRLPEHVDQAVAQVRYDALMARQKQISADNLSTMIGTTLPVLIEASSEPQLYEGRSMCQAPEVDGVTFVRTRAGGTTPVIGQPVAVKITETLEYDLIGEAR
jgi:ribosomal protein S12 methylthiotransferase